MRRVFTGHSGRHLSLHASGLVISLSGLLVVAPLLPEIIAQFQISPAIAGASLSVMWGINAVCQYPGGRYADQTSAPIVLLSSLVLVIFGFLVISVSTVFPQFVL